MNVYEKGEDKGKDAIKEHIYGGDNHIIKRLKTMQCIYCSLTQLGTKFKPFLGKGESLYLGMESIIVEARMGKERGKDIRKSEQLCRRKTQELCSTGRVEEETRNKGKKEAGES